MAEPHASTTLAVAGSAAAVTPLLLPALGDWSWVLFGAIGGATLSLSMMTEPLPYLRALWRFVANAVAALMFARLLQPAVLMAMKALGADQLQPEHMLMAVAALTAMYWRPIISRVVERAGRIFGGKSDVHTG